MRAVPVSGAMPMKRMLLVLLVVGLAAPSALAARNMVKNGGFEDGLVPGAPR